MRSIYQKAKAVVIWLGPDTADHRAKPATDSVRRISDFLCGKLNLQITDLSSRSNLYQEALYQNRHSLPPPDRCHFGSDALWQSLIWFYSHAYFTRLWVIQEVNASSNRIVHCGHQRIEWDRVDLVAGYMIMNTTFSHNFGFHETHCWWTATVTTERMRNPKNWLWMLYLASNFSCSDERDVIYGLRGLMSLPQYSPQTLLLNPDYSKSTTDVYRDSVEAALLDYQNTDVLLYLAGQESPSWIPRWDQKMLFRNPFRFGKALPWKPAGDTKVRWKIDKNANILHLSGIAIDTINSVSAYNERYFGNAMLDTASGREELAEYWPKILSTLSSTQSPPSLPLSSNVLTAAACALSFGLDADANPASEDTLLNNFLAYLKLILPHQIFKTYIPADLANPVKADVKPASQPGILQSFFTYLKLILPTQALNTHTPRDVSTTAEADGRAFGKPVWDFAYPDSGFFVTSSGLVGCSVCTPRAGDVVTAALGSTYPFIFRPCAGDDRREWFEIKGYAYVHGVMRGERAGGEVRDFEIH